MKNPVLTCIAAGAVGLVLIAACGDQRPSGADASAKPTSQPAAGQTSKPTRSYAEASKGARRGGPLTPAAEPNHTTLAMQHLTAKNYRNELKYLEQEIAKKETLLDNLDSPAPGASPSGSASAGAAPSSKPTASASSKPGGSPPPK